MLSGFSRTIAPTRKLALYTSHTGSSDSPRQVAPEDLSAQPIKQKQGGQAGNCRVERLGAAGTQGREKRHRQRLGLICPTAPECGNADRSSGCIPTTQGPAGRPVNVLHLGPLSLPLEPPRPLSYSLPGSGCSKSEQCVGQSLWDADVERCGRGLCSQIVKGWA